MPDEHLARLLCRVCCSHLRWHPRCINAKVGLNAKVNASSWHTVLFLACNYFCSLKTYLQQVPVYHYNTISAIPFFFFDKQWNTVVDKQNEKACFFTKLLYSGTSSDSIKTSCRCPTLHGFCSVGKETFNFDVVISSSPLDSPLEQSEPKLVNGLFYFSAVLSGVMLGETAGLLQCSSLMLVEILIKTT